MELNNKDLREVDLTEIDLIRKNLYKSNLSGKDLSSRDLKNVVLHCANLSNADLSNADLSGIDLSKTKFLKNAVFNNTKYNEKTKFPNDFKIKENLILVNTNENSKVYEKKEKISKAEITSGDNEIKNLVRKQEEYKITDKDTVSWRVKLRSIQASENLAKRVAFNSIFNQMKRGKLSGIIRKIPLQKKWQNGIIKTIQSPFFVSGLKLLTTNLLVEKDKISEDLALDLIKRAQDEIIEESMNFGVDLVEIGTTFVSNIFSSDQSLKEDEIIAEKVNENILTSK